MSRQESVELWRTTHDEWCAHDEEDDGIECDCHLSVIASLRKRLATARDRLGVAKDLLVGLGVPDPDAAIDAVIAGRGG